MNVFINNNKDELEMTRDGEVFDLIIENQDIFLLEGSKVEIKSKKGVKFYIKSNKFKVIRNVSFVKRVRFLFSGDLKNIIN